MNDFSEKLKILRQKELKKLNKELSKQIENRSMKNVTFIEFLTSNMTILGMKLVNI